jgi:Amidohydrolase
MVRTRLTRILSVITRFSVLAVSCRPTQPLTNESGGGAEEADEETTSPTCAIGVHAHLDGIYLESTNPAVWVSDFETASQTAIASFDSAEVTKAILMPPPFSPENADEPTAYDYTALAAIAASRPDRFVFGGGGFLLNPIMHSTNEADVTDEVRSSFRETAQSIVDAGAVVFAEMAALHLSFFEGHPFMEVQPDHPLFLLLADIAAENDIPIDLHMETVVEDDTPLAERFGEPNPSTLGENLTGLERLLAHNREARIVLAHVGWDNIGNKDTTLLRSLLAANENLYMSLRVVDDFQIDFPDTTPLDSSGNLQKDWLDLFTDFPDRFVLGADEFYGIEGLTIERPSSTSATWGLLNQLPANLANKIGCDNVRAIYGIQ